VIGGKWSRCPIRLFFPLCRWILSVQLPFLAYSVFKAVYRDVIGRMVTYQKTLGSVVKNPAVEMVEHTVDLGEGQFADRN
jgi:hypothetical protein